MSTKNNPWNSAWLVLGMSLAVALCGCTTGPGDTLSVYPEPPTLKQPFIESVNGNGAEAQMASKPEPAPERASEPAGPPEPTGESEQVGEPVARPPALDVAAEKPLPKIVIKDLNLTGDTEVAVVLRTLARAGNQNILISKGVSGTINFTFNNVAWDQAFRGVLAASGLSYVWEGDIIRVMTLEDMKQELEVEKIEHERKTVQADLRLVEPLALKVIKIRYTDAMKLGDTLRELLGSTGSGADGTAATRGSVTVDEDNNTVIIHAVTPDVRKMSDLVAMLDRPKAQILIEARIVEANRSTARELGVQWGGTYSGIEGSRLYTVSPGGGRSFAANFPAALPDDVGMTLGLLSERFGGGEILNLQLSVLQEDGKINILSSPSITTLDNEKAIIESGEERAYRETSGTGNDLDVSISWKKATLRLEVTPHMIDEDTLKIEVVAHKDSFDETKPESSGEFPVNTKSAETTILLKDGQTTVIGGLSQETKSESESGIPFLKDIPLIGHLFKGKRKAGTMDEILIFITPHILAGPIGARADGA